MTFERVHFVLIGMIAGLPLLSGCGTETLEEAGRDAIHFEIPHPQLDEMEAEVASALERQRQEVDALFDGGEASRVERAQAVGLLGQLYQAHRLIDAAEACYRQAHALDPEFFDWAYYLGVLSGRSGRLDEAAAAFREAVKLRPEDPQALIRLADLEVDRGNSEVAQKFYRRAVAVDPSLAVAAYGLGRVAADARRFEEAIAHFERALELQSRASVIHYHLGQAYRALGRLEEAESQLARSGPVKVAMPDPLMSQVNALVTGTSLYLVQGNTALRDGRLSVAAAAFRQAIEADPENPKGYQSLATVLTLARDLDGAVDQLQAAARLAPTDAQLLSDLGSALAELGRDQEALEHLSRAVELEPEHQQAQFNLANALARRGRLTEAAEHYRHLLEIDPDNETARARLATVLAQDGKLARAVPELRRVVELEPDEAEAHLNLGIALAESGDLPGAIEAHRRALELITDPAAAARAHFNLGVFHLRRNDRPAALDEFLQALANDEGMVAAHVNVAKILAVSGRLADSLRHFGRVSELEPDHETARLGEATVLMQMDRFAEAKTVLEEAVRRRPQDLSALHALARLLAAAPQPALRDGERSLNLVARLLKVSTVPSYVETQAMALAEVGRWGDATVRQGAVLAEYQRRGQTAKAERAARNLWRYERDQACCAEPRDALP